MLEYLTIEVPSECYKSYPAKNRSGSSKLTVYLTLEVLEGDGFEPRWKQMYSDIYLQRQNAYVWKMNISQHTRIE